MTNNIILLPAFAQVLLTLIVWVTLYKTRIDEMKAKRIHPQKLANSLDSKQLLTDSAPAANNFINMFEVPVLFYVLTVFVYITQTGDNIMLGILSAFVVSRYIHSFIQLTYNKVMNRFSVYLVGAALVWVGWGILGFRLFV